MISCEERAAARSVTVPQLVAAGFPPLVTLSPCTPPGPTQNRAAGKAALRTGLDSGAAFVLFVEDDIDLAPDFGAAVRDATSSGLDVAYLYVHDRPDRVSVLYGRDWRGIEAGDAQVPRFLIPGRPGYLYGSQAVLMTQEAALWAWGATVGGVAATDTCMIQAWIRARARVGIRVPHVVQHRADKTLEERRLPSNTRRREWQTSRSYHLPRSSLADNDNEIGTQPPHN
jgi:GR25 family glycosyltransferase involved in LPS biosynthesis